MYISSRFLENQPNEIYSHLSEKASKHTFLEPEKLQNHSNEGKGKEEKRKSNGCTLSSYYSYFGDGFWRKNLLDAKGLFGDNVILPIFICIYIYIYIYI